MRLVLLTGSGREHEHVSAVLADAFPDALAAIVVAKPDPAPRLSRLRRYVRRYTLAQLVSRVLAKTYQRVTGHARRFDQTLAKRLRPLDPEIRDRLVKDVKSHNGADCHELLDTMEPDIIAVYGTAIIREGVISRAREAILNLHTGISPRYRGADCVFWPLHESEPEWVGVTLHELTSGIDAGPVYGTARPEIEADDDEHSLFAKCVDVGAQLYVDVIERIRDGSARPTPQDLSQGKEYRFVDRTVSAERRVKRNLRDGLLASYCA